MWAVSEQAVQHCDREAFSLPLGMHQQAVQHCRFENLSLELCQQALEFSSRHERGRLPGWQEPQFPHA